MTNCTFFTTSVISAAVTKHPLPLPVRPTSQPHPVDKQFYFLLQRATALEQQANEVINFLKTHNRQVEANTIAKDEELVRKLVNDLKHVPKTGPDHVRLEQELSAVETRLAQEIQKTNYQFPPHTGTDVHKRQLLDRATLLEKQATDVIKQLKALNKAAEAAAMEKDEALVNKLAHDLQVQHNPNQVRLIESQLEAAENRLFTEVQNLAKLVAQTQEHEAAHLKLLQRATALQNDVDLVLKYLKLHKRESESIVLETEESVLKQLVIQLKSPTSGPFLEQQLDAIEIRLTQELDKFHKGNPEFGQEALRDQLTKKAILLQKQAEEAIKKLRAQNKTVEANVIAQDEEILKKLTIDLQTAIGLGLVRVQQAIQEAEARLMLELNGIH